MPKGRTIKAFIASPGDLAVERRTFKDVIDELNGGFGRGADVVFEPLGWEDSLSQVGRRSQAVINQDVDACDVFVLVMWRRWGQLAPDAAPYSSYTEEEFQRALARFELTGAPTIFVFFRHIDPGQMADPGEQLQRVLNFRKELEASRRVLYRGFFEGGFAAEIDRHLVAFARGECQPFEPGEGLPIVPGSLQKELDRHKDEARRAVEELEKLRADAARAREDAEMARAQARDALARAEAAESLGEAKAAEKALNLAKNAAEAALTGNIEEARQAFAKALDGTTNLEILHLGSQFFRRIGELDEAERLLRRSLAISGPETQTPGTAATYGSLGILLQIRGDLGGSETMHRKSLAINQMLNRQEGIADAYGNLGVLLKTRGDLDGAEEMYRQALAIAEKLGRQEGMAKVYVNLGVLLQTRRDLDGAEEMYRKSLAIVEKLGLLEGMANVYGNLGNLLQIRRDLDGAEEMYRKSLAIEEKLGRPEGMASDYGNLGSLLQIRGDLDGAEAMYRKSLAIEEKLGHPEGMASDYNNLGMLLETRGDLDGAEAMYRQALAMNEKLGRLKAIAKQYGNVGRLLRMCGDLKQAEEMRGKAQEIRQRLLHSAKDRVLKT
ncbi:MAG: tetratricopeptide repeat protein [Vicinamibacterales bacterium]